MQLRLDALANAPPHDVSINGPVSVLGQVDPDRFELRVLIMGMHTVVVPIEV